MKTRIAKFISECGYTSRRKAEELITQGQVYLNGKKVEEFATFIEEGDEVVVEGKKLEKPTEKRVWLFYKPRGVVCTRNDELGRKTIYDILPQQFKNMHYIGRLDLNSEGLLLLTNSSEVKQFYEHPSNKIVREYEARVFGEIDNEKHRALFSRAFQTFKVKDEETGKMMLYNAKVEPIKINEDSKNHWIRVALKEGKNREIRRICQDFDLSVSKLKRVKLGEFFLGTLQAGEVIEV